jgi:hypothetical protein
VNRQWFLRIFSLYCQRSCRDRRALHLMAKLNFAEISAVLNQDDFNLELLGYCLKWALATQERPPSTGGISFVPGTGSSTDFLDAVLQFFSKKMTLLLAETPGFFRGNFEGTK